MGEQELVRKWLIFLGYIRAFMKKYMVTDLKLFKRKTRSKQLTKVTKTRRLDKKQKLKY